MQFFARFSPELIRADRSRFQAYILCSLLQLNARASSLADSVFLAVDCNGRLDLELAEESNLAAIVFLLEYDRATFEATGGGKPMWMRIFKPFWMNRKSGA
jgi:hypothetical protein